MRPPILRWSLFAAAATAVSLFVRLAMAVAEPALETSEGGYIGTGILGRDGCLYAPSTDGPSGGIRKFTPDGGSILLISFSGDDGANRGSTPSVLTLGRDGAFYGTTKFGGTGGGGTVFRLSPDGVLTTLVDFGSDNASPRAPVGGALLALDGNVYGTTTLGGSEPAGGTLFKVTLAGILSVAVNFQGSQGSANGGDPKAPLIEGSDGRLYGTTAMFGSSVSGGAPGINGVAFRFDPASGVYTVIFNFNQLYSSYGSNIHLPFLQTRSGRLYGVSTVGGGEGAGCVFALGTNGGYGSVYSFSNNPFTSPGRFPVAGLTETPDGKLYGTAPGLGGSAQPGMVYRVATGSPLPTGSTIVARVFEAAHLSLGADGNLHGGTYRLRFGPTPTTGEASVANTSAGLSGTVNPNSADTVARFEYGLSPEALTALTSAQNLSSRATLTTISAELTGLAPGTTYYFRARGDNANQFQPQRGRIRSFTTAGPAQAQVAITPEPGGQRVRLRGLAGVPNVVQWSDDLVAWQSLPGTTTPDAAGFVEIVDPGQKTLPRRFYRAASAPGLSPRLGVRDPS